MLWLVLSTLLVAEHMTLNGSGGVTAPPWWHSLLGVVAIAVAVATRRSRPLLSLVVVVGLAMAETLVALTTELPFLVSYVVVLSVVSWLAGRNTDHARGFVVVVIVANVLILPLALPLRGEMPVIALVLNWFFIIFQSLLVVVLPWLLGRYRRQQSLLASAGWERAERMEHEQQMAVAQAQLRERTRIAQDMHDSLGHELSLIALRAGALEVAPDLTDRHRTAAAELRSSAASATERLGDIIGVLREHDEQAPLEPAGEGIGELVERASDSGLDVRLVSEGSGAALPPIVQRSAHRVLEEALTNVSKHAPGAPVTVQVRHATDETRLTVTNGPAPRAAAPSTASGGYGLPGLAERVRLLGGTLRSGPSHDGGFEVTAHLPHADVGAPPTAQLVQSESATALATARRRARRGLITAVAAPLAVGAALGLLMLAYYLAIGFTSVLEPEDYADLRVGQERTEIEAVLPPLQMLDDPSDDDVARPPGSTCEFYRPDGPFSITFAYRLCFVDGRLAAKDVIQTGEVPVEEEEPR